MRVVVIRDDEAAVWHLDSLEGGIKVVNTLSLPVQVHVDQSDGESFNLHIAPNNASSLTQAILQTGTVRVAVSSVNGLSAKQLDPQRLSIYLEYRSAYLVVVRLDEHGGNFILRLPTLTLHQGAQTMILWQIPQYVLSSIAEVLFAVTGMEFVFKEAPPSMKVIMMSAWLLTDALGNAIIILITMAAPFERQAYEFFGYGGMLAVVFFVFLVLARRYVYLADRPTIHADKNLALNRATEQDGGGPGRPRARASARRARVPSVEEV